MRILNCKFHDPETVSLALIPWFIDYNNTGLVNIAWELKERLEKEPDNTFCIVAIENEIAKAVLIGFTRKEDAFIWQAHALPGFKYAKLMFSLFVCWASNLGYTKIRAKTKRNLKALYRRWNFVPYGNEIERKI